VWWSFAVEYSHHTTTHDARTIATTHDVRTLQLDSRLNRTITHHHNQLGQVHIL